MNPKPITRTNPIPFLTHWEETSGQRIHFLLPPTHPHVPSSREGSRRKMGMASVAPVVEEWHSSPHPRRRQNLHHNPHPMVGRTPVGEVVLLGRGQQQEGP